MIIEGIKFIGKSKLFSPSGIVAMIATLSQIGINLLAILKLAAHLYPDKTALVYESGSLTYRELYIKTLNLRYVLYNKYKLRAKQSVAFACANHPSFIFALFATAGLGMDVYLLNYGLGKDRFNKLMNHYKFDFIVYDPEIVSFVEGVGYSDRSLQSSIIPKYVEEKPDRNSRIKRASFNKIVVLTSGTTGISVAAARKASIFVYLRPLITLSDKLQLSKYKSLYIAPPIFHGFGLISLLVSFIWGKEVYIHHRFDTVEANKIISRNKIEAIVLVPLMLQRMLLKDKSSLQSLKCIISGGAVLPVRVVKCVQNYLGDVLFNLYGTSEGGFCIMATPEDLKYYPATIGKPISGIKVRIIDDQGCDVQNNIPGQILIRSGWSVSPEKWVKTGDIGYRDNSGYYFFDGRIDDMIVSGGENVFPLELEEILSEHPAVSDVIVIGIEDEDFGQRLKAFVVLSNGTDASKEEIMSWLSKYSPRHIRPREIVIVDSIPINIIGKVDKRRLNY